MFNKGDKVRYKAKTDAPLWEGFEGVVLEDQENSYNVKVVSTNAGCQWDVDSKCQLRAYNLELVPRVVVAPEPDPEPVEEWEEISFSEIEQGDRIRFSYKQYGVVYTREGSADAPYDSKTWVTTEGNFVAEDYSIGFPATTDVKLERLVVPKPAPKLWTELAEIGTHGYTIDTNGRIDRILTKTEEDSWVVWYPDGGNKATRSNEDIYYVVIETKFFKMNSPAEHVQF